MEVDCLESPEINEQISRAEALWSVINGLAVKICTDLTKAASEGTLRSFMEVLTRSTNNYITITIPPFKPNTGYDHLKGQYKAFTTWLLGVLFYLIGAAPTQQDLQSCIDAQAFTLRILSRLQSTEFTGYARKYLMILDEISEFDEGEADKIVLNKFNVQPDAIERLNLIHLPVTITRKLVGTIQISIMKIIIKSGTNSWDLEELWRRILDVMKKSQLSSKLAAMEVIAQLLIFRYLTPEKIRVFVSYAAEVVRSIRAWRSRSVDTKFDILNESPNVLRSLLKHLPHSAEVVDFSFGIIDALASGAFADKSLEFAAVSKIREFLLKHPRGYSAAEGFQLLRYFEKCPEFRIIVAHFAIYELNSSARPGALIAVNASPLWRHFHNSLILKCDSREFAELRKYLEVARTISLWMMAKKIRGVLFEDPETPLRILRNSLESSNDANEVQLAFLCLMELMTVEEFPKSELQKILLLPWLPSKSAPNLAASRKLTATLKSLSTEAKLRCLEIICEFGRGKVRIKYLSICVTSNEPQIASAAILNSVLLLSDPDISFVDLNLHVLRPAVVAQRPALQEAIANVIGNIVCFLSGKARLVRTEWDLLTWTICCDICDKQFDYSHAIQDKFPTDEAIFSSYFAFFSSNSVAIRINMSQNLVKLSNHLESFNVNAVTKLWLPMIHDASPKVRENVAKSIAVLTRNRIRLVADERTVLEEDLPKDAEEFVNLVIDELGDALSIALDSLNESLQMTVIETAKEFGKMELPSAERRVCRMLIIGIIHADSTCNAVVSATLAFKDIAAFRNLAPKKLYLRYRKDFIELITQLVANNYVRSSYNITMSLSKVVQCIGYAGVREFVRKDGSLIVSYLVPMVLQVPQVKDLFKDIADFLDLDEREMFMEFYQHICAHVFLNETPQIGGECLELVSGLARLSTRELMTRSFIGIFRKLLLHFHDKMERVLICLEVISEFDLEPHVSLDSMDNIANYLKPQLHGVLVNFDVNLGPLSDQATQKATLGSLGALIKFMGPVHLSPMRYQVLATLRTCLNFTRPGFRKLCCYSWDCFLRNVSPEELGPLLPTICVSMIPLIDSCLQEVNAMLNFLLIDKKTALSQHISDIFFIDDLKVSAQISNIVASQVARATPTKFEAGLKMWLQRIKHETDEVRLRALIHLKHFLAQHRSQLNKMILSNTDVHPLVVELLDTLLAGCNEKAESIRLKCGECLGELGAVEPSLLPRRIVSCDDSKFILEMNAEFAFEFLQEFVRGLQTATQNVTCFSLAIQEILKAFEITPSGKNHALWTSLTSATQERILPFLNSHYKNTAVADTAEYPVYGSSGGSTFEAWLYNWAYSMMVIIKDPVLAGVLNACRPALRRDTRATMFCIPHIFTHIITNGEEAHRDLLLLEISAVINPGDQILDQELISRRPLRREMDDKPSSVRISDEARRVRCSQVIFSTLDHLMRWLGERRLQKDQKFQLVQNFVNRLDSFVLAEACYKSHEYHRALMYLERHMAFKNKGLSDQRESGLLAKIYTQLQEPDGISGILATQKQNPTLQQLVIAHEVSGQLQDAAACYEKLAQRLAEPKYIQGMIHCYLGLDQPFTAMKITEGLLSSRPELESLMIDHEPFWRLANFVQLTEDKSSVKVNLLEDLRRGVQPDLQNIKKRLVSLIGATSNQGSYHQQSYPYILKLHILNEFEKATGLMLESTTNLPTILNEWEQREQLIRASRGVESVLGMRRATLDLFAELAGQHPAADTLDLKKEIGKIWLKSAKIARKSGLYHQAYMYILSATDSCPSQELSIEQAQLYWQRNCQEDALVTLQRSFTNCFQPTEHYKEMPANSCPPERRNFAKAKLLFAKYNEETLHVDNDTMFHYYKEAVSAWKCWEKSYLAIAQHHEVMLERYPENSRDLKQKTIQSNIINYYGRALQFGCKYIHQSMPRMLTVWMDYAERVQLIPNANSEQVEMIDRMTKLIDYYTSRLPTYVWLTALSQIISRIKHPHQQIQDQLIKILVTLIAAHPHYCLWMMACVLSHQPEETQRGPAARIWNHELLREKRIQNIMLSYQRLWQRLIAFTYAKIPDDTSKYTVSSMCRALPELLRSSKFGPVMMPTSQFFRLSLPAGGDVSATHNPFPNESVSIVGIEEKVTVMSSLQKPRKISFRGSDGRLYDFMCKPEDDVRRDFRLMEFNGIVNKYLQKDPESRQRRLYIRTYTVIPLNEKTGLIEWVPNLIPFRQVLAKLYAERGLGMSHREILKLLQGGKLDVNRKNFLEKIIPRYPPIFGEWFRLTFPDPYSWYEARTAYIRTTAVMSMVGYILGLGDRHGENILLDRKCGDTVHVDFNCLFNTGETLKVPERVPFRLTQNMTAAMGPLGYEGPFRRSCETTLRVLRQQANTLISVLKPFVYTEEKNARESVRAIEQRFAGFVKASSAKESKEKKEKNSMVKLSVEGQANHLILEAISVDNLCQMFAGWGPHY